MWSFLGAFGSGMRKLVKGGCYIVGHGEGDSASGVVPVEVQTEIFCALPVNCDIVLFF